MSFPSIALVRKHACTPALAPAETMTCVFNLVTLYGVLTQHCLPKLKGRRARGSKEKVSKTGDEERKDHKQEERKRVLFISTFKISPLRHCPQQRWLTVISAFFF